MEGGEKKEEEEKEPNGEQEVKESAKSKRSKFKRLNALYISGEEQEKKDEEEGQ
jgi:hypothetical protein